MRRLFKLVNSGIVIFFLFTGSTVKAGGPIYVSPSGTASSWDSPITIHPESGTCASFSNAQTISKIEENISYWSNISGIDLNFTVRTGSIGTVDSSNYATYFVDSSDDAGYSDDINPIMFDDTGEIVSTIFGSGSEYYVLGFAGPDAFDSDYETIQDGQAVFNCRCLSGNSLGDCSVQGATVLFSEDDLDFTMTHEIGHMIGLDHTQVNQALDTTCNTTQLGDCDDIPTMYPVSVDAADQISPTRDDEVALSSLYGLSNLGEGMCTVTGVLLDSAGNSLRCADVQAQSDNTEDTISTVSGYYAVAEDKDGDHYTSDSGECISGCGDFILRGLDPEKNYTIKVMPIDTDWVGGSGIGPCRDAQLTSIVEEEIGTVASGDCAAGSTKALGTITTKSTGGTEEGEASEDDGSSDSSASGASSEEFPPLCSVVKKADPFYGWFLAGLIGLQLMIIFRLKRSAPS